MSIIHLNKKQYTLFILVGFFSSEKLIIVHVCTFVNRLSAIGVYFLVHVHVIWKSATIKLQKSDDKKTPFK